jgi:Flp pilus assembly pilin Flp
VTRRHGTLRRLVADFRGATMVEFAIVMPVFTVMICGFLDLGHWAYVRSTTSGALEQVARSAGVGGAAVNTTAFETQVETLVKNVAPFATFTWDRDSYNRFSSLGKPEKLTSDIDGDGNYDPGDCWEDLEPNGVYDTEPGRDGIGGADDILLYRVTVNFQPLIPLAKMLPGVPNVRQVNALTIVKRQPFAAQTVPLIRC